MSDYRVVYRKGYGALLWQVQQDGSANAYTFTQPQAERIARALRVLDAMEREQDERPTGGNNEHTAAGGWGYPALAQARGEG